MENIDIEVIRRRVRNALLTAQNERAARREIRLIGNGLPRGYLQEGSPIVRFNENGSRDGLFQFSALPDGEGQMISVHVTAEDFDRFSLQMMMDGLKATHPNAVAVSVTARLRTIERCDKLDPRDIPPGKVERVQMVCGRDTAGEIEFYIEVQFVDTTPESAAA